MCFFLNNLEFYINFWKNFQHTIQLKNTKKTFTSVKSVEAEEFTPTDNTGLQKNFPTIIFQYSVRFYPTEYEYERHIFPSNPDLVFKLCLCSR